MNETIYVIENMVSRRVYVGRTKYDARMRFDAHYINQKSQLGRDMRTLGKTNFRMRVLAEVPVRDAGGMERLFTHLLESNVPEFGYNNPSIYRWPD